MESVVINDVCNKRVFPPKQSYYIIRWQFLWNIGNAHSLHQSKVGIVLQLCKLRCSARHCVQTIYSLDPAIRHRKDTKISLENQFQVTSYLVRHDVILHFTESDTMLTFIIQIHSWISQVLMIFFLQNRTRHHL